MVPRFLKYMLFNQYNMYVDHMMALNMSLKKQIILSTYMDLCVN